MKKETTTTKKEAQLMEALKKANKENEKLAKKLEQSRISSDRLRKELKKNDGRTVELTEEQEQSLSNLSIDMNIPNLLSD